MSVFHGFAGDGLGVAVNHSGQLIEVNLQHGQLLTDVIEQLTRNAGALGFLRAEQPSSHFADACKACAQIRLGPAASRPVYEESDDQCGLNGHQCHCAKDVCAVAIPHAWLTEHDHAVGRQQAAIESPPIELSGVEHVLVAVHLADRNVRRWFTAEHAQTDLGRGFAMQFEAVKVPTNGASAQVLIDKYVDRCGGDGGNPRRHAPHGALGGQTPYERLMAKARPEVSPAS